MRIEHVDPVFERRVYDFVRDERRRRARLIERQREQVFEARMLAYFEVRLALLGAPWDVRCWTEDAPSGVGRFYVCCSLLVGGQPFRGRLPFRAEWAPAMVRDVARSRVRELVEMVKRKGLV